MAYPLGLPSLLALIIIPGCFWGQDQVLEPWRAALVPPPGATAGMKQVFVFDNGAEPATLDPALMTGVPEGRLALGLFEGLTTIDPKTLEPRPGLAISWTIDPGSRIYTFHLRPDARWSDGRPLTAHDIVDSWRRVLTASTGAAYAYQLFPVRGAEAFLKGRSTDPSTIGATAVDDHTLRVELGHPCGYFLALTSFPTLMPVRTDLVARWGDRWIRPEHMVCDGPFRLAAWLPRQRIVLTPNPYYHDASAITLTRVVALPYDDADAAYRQYLGGHVDWLTTVPQAKLAEAERNPDYYAAPYLGVAYVRFAVAHGPLADTRVRRALSMALDRKALTSQVLRGGQVPTTASCPAFGGYTPVAPAEGDATAARALLTQAGYGPGHPLPVLELMFATSDRNRLLAEAMVQEWREALGVTVSLRTCEWKSYLADLDNTNYQIALTSWIGDYADPNTFYDLWVTNGGNNRTGWSDPTYDRILAQSQAEGDPSARRRLFQQLEDILDRERPVAPLYIFVNQGLIRDTVHGWYGNILDQHPFQYLWIGP